MDCQYHFLLLYDETNESPSLRPSSGPTSWPSPSRYSPLTRSVSFQDYDEEIILIHPQLLAISALLLQVQAALILQPTATPSQKQLGTRIHYSLQLFSILAFLSAFTIIEINKGDHPHFVSPHGILGLLTVIFVVLQALGGVIQYLLPVPILGSVEAGKRFYKYHRWSGYVLLLLEVSTVVAATQTGYNLAVIRIPAWAVVIAIILTLAGVGARIKKHKLGL